jgi:hypothetical protein
MSKYAIKLNATEGSAVIYALMSRRKDLEQTCNRLMRQVDEEQQPDRQGKLLKALQLNHQGRDAITNVLDRLIAIRDGEL